MHIEHPDISLCFSLKPMFLKMCFSIHLWENQLGIKCRSLSGENQESAGFFHKFSRWFYAHWESLLFSFLKWTESNADIYVSSLIHYILPISYTTSLVLDVWSRDPWRSTDPGGLWSQNYFHSNNKTLFIFFTIILSWIYSGVFQRLHNIFTTIWKVW